MKLYYNPKSRAVIAKWMLDECDVEYEIVPIDFEKREHKTPEQNRRFNNEKDLQRELSLRQSSFRSRH